MRKFKIVGGEDNHCFRMGEVVEYVGDGYDYDPECVAIYAKGSCGSTQTLFTGTDIPDAVEILEEEV